MKTHVKYSLFNLSLVFFIIATVWHASFAIDPKQMCRISCDPENLKIGVKLGEEPLKAALRMELQDQTYPIVCGCEIGKTGINDYIGEHACRHAYDFSVGNINESKNSIQINFGYQQRQIDDFLWGHIETFRVNSDIKSFLKPTIVDNTLSFSLSDLEVTDSEFHGFAAVASAILLGPLFEFGNPIVGVTDNLIMAHVITESIVNMIANDLAGDMTRDFGGFDFNLLFDKLNILTNYQSEGLITATNAEFKETNGDNYGGLWVYFDIDAQVAERLFNEVIVFAEENGILTALKPLIELQDLVAMNGFDISKITSAHKNLIISLSGAGEYLPTVLDPARKTIATYVETPAEPVESSGDAIYPLPVNYIDGKTVAVTASPWLRPNFDRTSIDLTNESWGPTPAAFALKIKEALDKMAPEHKLILLGKSMGGCKMQEIINELSILNVPVDLLIIVDGSCRVADQSSENKDIPVTVKRAYNYRQISVQPENDYQNGFKITTTFPTIGSDVVVGDVGNDIGELMCEGVGHNDIDECPALLVEIDKIIRGILRVPDGTSLAKVSISILNEGQNETNIVKPRIYIQNISSIPISDFQVYYYFAVEDGKAPVVDDYYTPFSTPVLESTGINTYRLVYNFAGATLSPGSVLPNSDGSIVGIHYSDWSPVDKSMHLAYNLSNGFNPSENLDVRLNDGSYLFGNVISTGEDDEEVPDTIQGDIYITGNTTIPVPPAGVTVRVNKPEYLHGLMFTVRNAGTEDYTEVIWNGVLDQNANDCQARSALLSGNGAQINNICTPKDLDEKMSFEIRSQDGKAHSVMIEIFEWFNGTGCQ